MWNRNYHRICGNPRLENLEKQENRARGDSEAGVHRHWQNKAEASLHRVRLPTKGQHKQHAKKRRNFPPRPSLVLLLPRG